MNRSTIIPLPYRPDSADWFAALRHLPGAVFLDSARPHCTLGRFDLMAALPLRLLETRAGRTTISGDHGTRTRAGAPLALLAEEMQRVLPFAPAFSGEWPFAGGIIGCFGYELGRNLARLPARAGSCGYPDMRAGIYGWALMQDHDRRQAALILSDAVDAAERARVMALLAAPPPPEPRPYTLESAFTSNTDRAAYARAFARIQHYIRAGDCYQVNFAQRLQARASGDPWAAYLRLRRRMASPFSAYLPAAGATVLSFSPERFLHVADGRVETRPIKGTVRRAADPEADRQQIARLLGSEKDRAENIMIVDLLRNDLSKSCRTGSVHVEKLCALESHANLHHLVSVVSGQLRADQSPLALLANCFPGGSITGAPKLRAMQIIDELEADPRDVYCGSIGYLSRNGVMDTSITIRSLVASDAAVYAWGGGGIVADSDCESEYRESMMKIEPLLNGLTAAAEPVRANGRSRA